MNKKQKSLFNKGFSLVELIVVIAIMAVLVGLIAPQFVKYVTQSKSSADTQNIEMLQGAAHGVLADPTFETDKDCSGGVTFTIAVDVNGDVTITDNVEGNFKTLLDIALGKNGDGDVKYPKAQDTSESFIITVTGTVTDGYSAAVELN